MGDYGNLLDFSLRTMDTENVWRVQYWGADHDITTTDLTPSITSLNEWVQFVHVYTGTQTKIFANGYLVGEWDDALNTSDAYNLMVGAYHASINVDDEVVTEARFDGIIDDFKLWNYALSDADAVRLYTTDTGESRCLRGETPAYDLNGDCRVDLDDFVAIASAWLESNLISPQP